MSPRIDWRDATRDDRSALEQFRCTSPAPRDPRGRPLPHPAPYEAEVQRWLRTHKPPGSPDEIFRVGIDHEGAIAAVAVTSQLAVPDGLTFKTLALAVTHGLRGTGLGRACLEDSLRQMNVRALEAGAEQFLVFGLIDPRNVASQRTCASLEFAHVADLDGYQQWVRIIAIQAHEAS